LPTGVPAPGAVKGFLRKLENIGAKLGSGRLGKAGVGGRLAGEGWGRGKAGVGRLGSGLPFLFLLEAL
jgi:hypothetical protein